MNARDLGGVALGRAAPFSSDTASTFPSGPPGAAQHTKAPSHASAEAGAATREYMEARKGADAGLIHNAHDLIIPLSWTTIRIPYRPQLVTFTMTPRRPRRFA